LAKISITGVLKTRQKVRFLTIVFATLIFGVSLWQIVVNNPFGTKAENNGCLGGVCTISGVGSLAPTATGEMFCTSGIQLDYNAKLATGCSGGQTIIGASDSLIFSSGATVTTYFENNVKNLDLQSGTVVTHEGLDSADTDSRIAGKKVYIKAVEFIYIKDGARINVDGKGYNGAQTSLTHTDGYPEYSLGAGHGGYGYNVGVSKYAWGGGGSSSVATGGTASSYINGTTTTPTAFPSLSASTLLHGASGGGTCFQDGTKDCSGGGNGGGYVHLEAPKIEIFPAAVISANGREPNTPSSKLPAGGGAGGTIEIVGKKADSSAGLIYYWPDFPIVTESDRVTKGGLSPFTSQYSGNNGTVTYPDGTSKTISTTMSAVGGKGGSTSWFPPAVAGGGAGGKVSLSGGYLPLCQINASSPKDANGHYYIPAACEGQDVVISGDAEVYADSVKVLNTTQITERTSCAESSNSSCDTYRKFNSLLIKDTSKLTHAAVTADEAYTQSRFVGTNKSLADETIGTGRWKKVDVETLLDLTIQDQATVNVSSKGYPGGYFCVSGVCTSSGTKNYSGYGPGGSLGGQWPWVNLSVNCGYGASYGSIGSAKKDCATLTDTSALKYWSSDLSLSGQFEFGSGGGGLKLQVGSLSIDTGGSGGGRIKLIVGGTLNINPTNNSNVVISNGGDSICFGATAPSCGGGGSGGSILIKAKNFSILSSGTPLGITVGLPNNPLTATPGSVISDIYLPVYFQANGGNGGVSGASQGGGGGAGRVMVKKIASGSVPTVQKTLSPIKRAGVANNSFDPYSLQKDDVIKVSLDVYGVEDVVDFTDNWFTTVDTKKCAYVVGSGTYSDSSGIPDPWLDGSAGADGYMLSLNQTMNNSNGKIVISYQCQLQ